MSKYIIKNCPCLKTKISYKDKEWINACSELRNTENDRCCKDIENCLIKQVVGKCKERIENDSCLNCEDFEKQKHCWECDYEHHREDVYLGRASVCFAKDILQLFEIEEQSNDMENN